MKHTILVALVFSSAAFLGGCAADSAGYDPDNEYSPGYTGYTVMDEDYGISNGYGPSFWSPRYKYYTGHTQLPGSHGAYGDGGFYR